MAAAAVLVSVATWVALGDDYVRFGILHCIAVAMLVGPLLVPLRWWNVPLGVAVIIAGVWLDERPATDSLGLYVLGVQREGATPVDWYPLMPWLGVMMIGLAVGLALYPAGAPRPVDPASARAVLGARPRRARAPLAADLPGAPAGADPADRRGAGPGRRLLELERVRVAPPEVRRWRP